VNYIKNFDVENHINTNGKTMIPNRVRHLNYRKVGLQ